jgi:hypothetical protein
MMIVRAPVGSAIIKALNFEKQSEFVMQPVEALLRAQPGWTAAVARGATDLGAVIDHVVHGSALERTLWQLKQEGYMPNF